MHICSSCNRDILPPSPVATYEDRYYHPDCLTCSTCRKSLSGKQFVKEKNGNLVCEECNEKFAPKCTKCGLTFKSGQSYKKINDHTFYHNECFKCAGPCRKPMAGEFYELDGRFICTDCYDQFGAACLDKAPGDDRRPAPVPAPMPTPAPPIPTSEPPSSSSNRDLNNLTSRFEGTKLDDSKNTPKLKVESLPAVERTRDGTSSSTTATATPDQSSGKKEELICAKCGEKLTGTYTVYNEKKYHTKCFVCCQCNQEFTEKSFFKLNGNPLCRQCHSKNLVDTSSKCNKCFQPILDTIVTFKGREFHDYCLVCSDCSKKLVGQSIYTDKQERPFCVDCFTRKEGKTCAKCFRTIAPNQSNLVFESKHFHKECFTCKRCSRAISSSESFYKSDDGDDGIVCEKCIS